MGQRAESSGIHLTEQDAAIIKAMLARGDRQHDIAAWFGVNGGRIGEIATGRKFGNVAIADRRNLPPPGPYPTGKESMIALAALQKAKVVIEQAEAVLQAYC